MPDRLASLSLNAPTPACVAISMPPPRNQQIVVGTGEPVLTVRIHNDRGERAIRSLEELEICEAFIRGDVDFDGDLSAAASLHRMLHDSHPWLKLWRRVKPLVVGRKRCNPEWISLHYDSDNIQLVAADRDWHTYTPGIYESDHDTLGVARGASSRMRTACSNSAKARRCSKSGAAGAGSRASARCVG
jgi:hypothetical protein